MFVVMGCPHSVFRVGVRGDRALTRAFATQVLVSSFQSDSATPQLSQIMVKAPSSHGLHQKYKPWRKGKSQKTSKPSSSLKQQLRGVQRLIQRKGSNPELESKRKAIEDEIAAKQKTEIEKTNATTSHRKRFIERQRTMRMYTKLSKEKEPNEDALVALALDQVYIAHYPLDQSKYVNLYATNQQRRTDMNARTLYKIAKMRSLVLERLSQQSKLSSSSSWVPAGQYNRIARFKKWSTNQERTTFGIREVGSKVAAASATSDTAADSRFQVSVREQDLLAKADKIVEDSGSDDSDAESDTSEKKVPAKGAKRDLGDGERATNPPPIPKRSKSEEEEHATAAAAAAAAAESSADGSSSSSSSSSDSSSSDSSSSSAEDESNSATAVKAARVKSKPSNSMLNDGFLVAESTANVFENAPRQAPTMPQGDKSQGKPPGDCNSAQYPHNYSTMPKVGPRKDRSLGNFVKSNEEHKIAKDTQGTCCQRKIYSEANQALCIDLVTIMKSPSVFSITLLLCGQSHSSFPFWCSITKQDMI